VVVHPKDDNIVYLGCGGPGRSDNGGTIFKTTDGGKSWERLPLTADHNIQRIVIRSDKPEEVWAVSGQDYVDEGSIYKSNNGGKSWKKVATELEETWFDEIVLTADNPPVILVGGGKGVYRSKDGGKSWSKLNISGWDDDSWCRALAVDPSDTRKVYAQCYYKFSKSTDSGDHWKTYDLVLGSAEFDLLALAVDPQRPGVLYGGDVCLGIIKSENDGINWGNINQGVNANHIFQIAVSPHNPQVIAASTMVGVYVRQGDNQWKVIEYYPSYTLTFDPKNGSTLFAGFDGWLGKYNLANGDVTSLEFPEQTVNAIALNPTNPEILYVGTEFYSMDRGGLYKSTDEGDNWKSVMVKSAPINVIKVNPNNRDTLYAGSGLFYAPVIKGNLYKSTDKGEKWQMTSLGDVVINTIKINPDDPEIIYVGSGAPGVDSRVGIFKSVDGGSTWKWSGKGLPADGPVVDIDLDPKHTQMLFATTFDKGIFVSKDGGKYWTILGMSDYWAYDVTPSLREEIARGHASSSMVNRFYTGTASGLYQYNSSGTGMVTGMITNNTTGRGITGAQVIASTGGAAFTVEGAYLIVTSAGNCTISASAEGYSSNSCAVTIVSGNTISADLTLTLLSESGTISGAITGFSAEVPIEGAKIIVDPGGYSAESHAEGGYTLEDVVPGTYTVSAFKEGYSMDRESGVSVSEGETQQVDFSLSVLGTGSIGGVITDGSSGEAVDGVEVSVDPGGFFTTSDSEGSYIISDIKTGSYALSVSHGGYLHYKKRNIEVGQDETVSLNIELQPCSFSILGLSRKELKKLRSLRDEVLSQNRMGRKWVSLFYQHAPTISRCIFSDPTFKERLLEIMSELIPKLEYILATGKVGISSQLIKKVEECFTILGRSGGFKLNADIYRLITLLHDKEVLKQFGVILEEQAQKPK
jgi:photosystem II stability/assembly factor-like uncharacterized protein